MHRRDWLRAAILGICLATSYAVDALAQYNPTLVPRVPSIAFVTSGTTGHLKQYKQFYLAAYGNGSAAVNDGGEGTFTQVTSCSDDLALTCIHDADGVAFHRDNTNGDLRQMGATFGSVYDGAATSPSNPASVVSLLNTAAPILLGLGITTIHTGAVNLHLGTNYTLPADMTLDCDANQGGQRINSDYRYVTGARDPRASLHHRPEIRFLRPRKAQELPCRTQRWLVRADHQFSHQHAGFAHGGFAIRRNGHHD
jgi:hypothetical protein